MTDHNFYEAQERYKKLLQSDNPLVRTAAVEAIYQASLAPLQKMIGQINSSNDTITMLGAAAFALGAIHASLFPDQPNADLRMELSLEVMVATISLAYATAWRDVDKIIEYSDKLAALGRRIEAITEAHNTEKPNDAHTH